jgi:large subunit ribosomal protein L22
MVKYTYSKKIEEEENVAKAVGVALPISTKQSIEICNFIRRKPLEKAKQMLIDVMNKKIAVPFKRFNDDMGHKRGKIAAGRYPEKSCSHILKLLESVEANAQFKGLNTANLAITHICAQKAARPWHYGRQRRRKMKRTNIEVIVEEKAVEKKEEKTDKETKKPEVKKEKKGVKEAKKPETKEKKPEVKESIKKETKEKEKTK